MQLYAGKVSVGRQDIGPFRAHVFHRSDLTAPEVTVLRLIHGDDAVTDLKPREDIKRSQAEEWARLEGLYVSERRNPLVAAFGPALSARMPHKLNLDAVEEEAATPEA